MRFWSIVFDTEIFCFHGNSYLGSGRYKARWLTGGTVALLLGSVVLSLPHFTTGHYEWGRSEAKTCDVSGIKFI